MVQFRGYYLQEANNLKFDLYNKNDLLRIILDILSDKARSRGAAFGYSFQSTYREFMGKIGALYVKEIIKTINKYFEPYTKTPNKPNRDEEEIHARLHYVVNTLFNDQSEDYTSPFIKMRDMYGGVPPDMNGNDYQLLIDRMPRYPVLKETDPWLFGEDGKIHDNVYIIIRGVSQYSMVGIKGAINYLINLLTDPRIDAQRYDVLRHVMDFIFEERITPEMAQRLHLQYASTITSRMQAFIKSPTLATIRKMYADYERLLEHISALEQEMDKSMIDKESTVLEQWPDGTRMIQPTTKQLCGYIGKKMRHCVGGYNPLDPYSLIIQLQGSGGEMAATIQLVPSEEEWERVYVVEQIKGPSNARVNDKYKKYLEDFFHKYQDTQLQVRTDFGSTLILIDMPYDVTYA
jgi:hypothetical protein